MSAWEKLRTTRGLRNLAVMGLASAASAAVNAAATSPEAVWYAELDNLSWRPQPAVFPLVWTLLYATSPSSPLQD